MEAIECILSRRSVGRVRAPGPDDAALRDLLAAATPPPRPPVDLDAHTTWMQT